RLASIWRTLAEQVRIQPVIWQDLATQSRLATQERRLATQKNRVLYSRVWT
ncbi:hypothetical protein A2U01_0116177, partial [Trifolium medium]|nr:hypothetical protein [Trifolium medium]